MTGTTRRTDDGVEGEGSYTGAEQYNEETREAAKDKDRIARDANAAAKALDGDEADALEAAAEKGRQPARE